MTNDAKMTVQVDVSKDFLVDEIARKSEADLVDYFKDLTKQVLFKRRYTTRYSNSISEYELSDWISDWIKDYIKEAIQDNKDLIIKEAARGLANSMRRSKLVREKFCEYLEEEITS